MVGNNSFFRLVLITFMTIIAVALGTLLVVEATNRTSSPAPNNLSTTLVCEDTQTCRLEVKITADTENISGVVVVETEGGVRFLPETGRIEVDKNGHRATSVETVRVPILESRILILPLVPDRSTLFSGAYGVNVRLVGSGLNEMRFTSTQNIHVLVPTMGQAFILKDAQQLDAYYGLFQPGTGNLAYVVDIDPLTRTHGNIFVKVNGVDNAEVALHVTDGVQFDVTSHSTARLAAGMIRPEGYRVLAFSFHYISGSYTGPRSIIAGLNSGGETSWMERLPLQLQVNDGQLSGQPHLTVSAAVAEQVDILPEIGIGVGTSFHWDRPVENFSGNLFDAYESFVSGTVVMDWETFQKQVLLYNPHLSQTGQMFQANHIYLMPRPDLNA